MTGEFPTIFSLLALAACGAFIGTLLWPADTTLGQWLDG